MKKNFKASFPVFEPNLQITFYQRLQEFKNKYLREALAYSLSKVKITDVDSELGALVEDRMLRKLALNQIRGEVFFPVPILIRTNPYLLGYYRLLYGISQKEFYSASPFKSFKRMEESGIIPKGIDDADLERLCKSLIVTAGLLLDSMEPLSVDIANHLQLLTLGSQFRGSHNNTIGGDATLEVIGLIKAITQNNISSEKENCIILENDSGNSVTIEFLSDPDVKITSVLGEDIRPILSIEIKGGKDVSNVHNRMGEAEKSHQKAKQYGFREFWTLVRANIDLKIAEKESPTTNLFLTLTLN